MKVLLVNKFHYRKGGSETYYFTLAESLADCGHEAVFFSMRDPEHNLPCAQETFFVSHGSVDGPVRSRIRMAAHIAYSKEAYRNMTQLLRSERPDLVVLNNIHRQLSLSVIDAAKNFDPKLPVFWTVHDLAIACPAYLMLDGAGEICEKCLDGNFGHCVENRCVKGSRLMGLLAKFEADFIRRMGLYSKVDLYICPSEFYMRILQKAGISEDRLTVMRNPLPLRTQYKESCGEGGYVLYFGRLSREKGLSMLIDAMEKAGGRLEIVGTGPMEEELRARAKRTAAQRIVFRGFLAGEALTGCIERSRCVVAPSVWYENQPYSICEAMALGKPVIASQYGGLPELVEHGRNGYIYDAASDGAVDHLADCIGKMLALPENEYREMARYSLRKAERMFDARQYVSTLERHFERVRRETASPGTFHKN